MDLRDNINQHSVRLRRVCMVKEASKAKLGVESRFLKRRLSWRYWREFPALTAATAKIFIRHDRTILLCAMCLDLLYIICEHVRERPLTSRVFVCPKCRGYNVPPTFHYSHSACGKTHPESRVCLRLSRLSKFLPEISNILRGRHSVCNPTPKVLVFQAVCRAVCTALEILHVFLCY